MHFREFKMFVYFLFFWGNREKNQTILEEKLKQKLKITPL